MTRKIAAKIQSPLIERVIHGLNDPIRYGFAVMREKEIASLDFKVLVLRATIEVASGRNNNFDFWMHTAHAYLGKDCLVQDEDVTTILLAPRRMNPESDAHLLCYQGLLSEVRGDELAAKRYYHKAIALNSALAKDRLAFLSKHCCDRQNDGQYGKLFSKRQSTRSQWMGCVPHIQVSRCEM